ncbi:DUF2267 domain-containing protein [Sulfitobacter sp. JB4-11]|uniref:DUF2267 domain-containing protein n=1 Tax=Sulfitobacter rhodophyticola TaxID=3238304 RepID=UPI003516B253
MSAQGLQVIDQSVQLTHEWINELAGRLGWSSKRSTLRLMRVVLQHLRDHLMPDELAHLSAQLPIFIRGVMFEGWVPKRTPVKERTASGFIKSIEEQFGDDPEYRGDMDLKCVFELLNARIMRGEVNDIRATLSTPIRDLWPEP